MTQPQFTEFSKLRDSFKAECKRILETNPELREHIQALMDSKNAKYPLENPVVYNSALDSITQESTPELILIADNPGFNEQLNINKSYLVGLSGKLAERFFKEKLNIDFRKNIILLNKCPIHTAKTQDLKNLKIDTGMLSLSMEFMASLACKMALCLKVPIWICGYSELAQKKIFSPWSQQFVKEVNRSNIYSNSFVFRHFSMNQFSIDFKTACAKSLHYIDNPIENNKVLIELGASYRKKYLEPYEFS